MNPRRSAHCLPLPAGERVGERANSTLFAKRWSALLVACLAAPVLAIDVQYQVAVRTDVRARTPLPGDVRADVPTGDLELGPTADVTLGGDTATFSLQYAPTLIWREPQTGGRLLPLHRGRLTFANRWQRATLLVTEDAAYGVADIGALRGDPSAPATSVVGVQTVGSVPYVRSATLVSLDTRPGDRVSLAFSGGFSVSGSIEQSDTLPLQYGPVGAVQARVAVSRTDGLTTLAGVTSAQFVTGAEQLVASLSETWDHQVSRTVALTLGAGAAFTREVAVAREPAAIYPTPGLYLDVLPVAAASLGWRDVLSGHPLRLDASLRMAPFSDRFTANVYERLEGRLAGEWLPERRWTVTAAAGAAVALPLGASLVAPQVTNAAQAGDRVISGEANVAWTPETWLLLQASARVLWTAQASASTTQTQSAVQAVGTVSVTVLQRDSLAW